MRSRSESSCDRRLRAELGDDFDFDDLEADEERDILCCGAVESEPGSES